VKGPKVRLSAEVYENSGVTRKLCCTDHPRLAFHVDPAQEQTVLAEKPVSEEHLPAD
jgi:hypothetical protein